MYCGIDISKNKSQICVIDGFGTIISELEITHDKKGFEKLVRILTPETRIGMESTGNYSKTIFSFLSRSYQVHYIDNLRIRIFCNLHRLHLKNDKVDAHMIAEYLLCELPSFVPSKTSELKDLCRLYDKLVRETARYKVSFKSQLSIIFPELEDECYLQKPNGYAYLLLKYPTPKQIVEATDEEVYKALVENLKKASFFNIGHAKKVKELAKKSVGVKDYPVNNFTHTIKIILMYQEMIEKLKLNMKVILEKSIYAKMLNQRGYSIVSLATIVGEVGDIRRFPNHRKFASYCGLAVSENQSGKAKSVNCFITKRGNKYLRSMFYNMVLPQLAAKEGFSDFYHRLKSKGKASKECMVAVSRKIAVKTYYDMLRCHDENLNLQQ